VTARAHRGAARLAYAVLLTGLAAAAAAEPRLYRSGEGFEFAYPEPLVAGRFRDTTSPEVEASLHERGQESPWKRAVALVDPARLGSRGTVDAIPVGEVAVVSVIAVRGQKADFLRRHFFRDQWKTTVGGREVYRLPGYPGPYGDALFYYLMPIRDGEVLELFAHRRHLDAARTETGYDQVIEGIIASFRLIAPGG
jgi:hypothetical protein